MLVANVPKCQGYPNWWLGQRWTHNFLLHPHSLFSSNRYSRRCLLPHLPCSSSRRMRHIIWKWEFGIPPSPLSSAWIKNSITMPPLTNCSNKNYLTRSLFSAMVNLFCKVISKPYTSWAFFPRSAFSVSFHKFPQSEKESGARDDNKMFEQITPFWCSRCPRSNIHHAAFH